MLRRLSVFIVKYFFQLKIALHEFQSLFGFFIFLILINQLFSGVMLSFTEIPESMYILLTREEDSCENYYVDDFLFLHERGVDLLVLFLYLHICRKLYEGVYNIEQEQA
jgi:quinol-cytochrome oxidoreductase complex cytochrome b subunit